MIRKDYLVETANGTEGGQQSERVKQELIDMISKAFSAGAIVEVKIVEGVDLGDESKRFSKLRLDIISNTDYDKFN